MGWRRSFLDSRSIDRIVVAISCSRFEPHRPRSPASASPEGPQRRPRRRRIVRLAVVAGRVALLISAAWFATRFDPLGRASAAYGRQQYPRRAEGGPRSSRAVPRRSVRLADGGAVPDPAGPPRRGRGALSSGRAARSSMTCRTAPMGWSSPAIPRGPRRSTSSSWRADPMTSLALKRLAAVRMGRKEWRATLELADRLIAIPSEEVAGLDPGRDRPPRVEALRAGGRGRPSGPRARPRR